MNINHRFIITAFALAAMPFSPLRAEAPVPAGSIRPTHKMAPADLPGAAKISFQNALTAALAAVPGGVIKAELEVEDGSLLYSFEIVGADKSITEVEVDAGNGKILDTDVETPRKGRKEDKASEHND